jgi:hypothetical protein
MRNLTMADGRLDAPCHRMKRLEFWRVFIDAEHMASDLLASDLHDAFVYYQFFPISEIRSPHSALVSPRAIGSTHAAIAILRSRGVYRSSCSRKALRLRQLTFLIRIVGGRKAGIRSRLRTE